MSTIKVDTIATRTGSGNITVSNNIAGGGTISGTNLSASGTLAVTGNTTMGGTAAITGKITSTAGITFGSDTAAANALDDYEEGTWTPAIIGSATAGSSPTGVGTYTKVGRLVTATATFGNVTVSGAAGNTYISGLPFSAVNGSSGAAHGAVGTSNYGTDTLVGSVLNGETVIRIRGANTTIYKTISNAASIYMLCTVAYETST